MTDSTIGRVFTTLRSRLQDPAVLVIIAVVFLISAVGQAILQALVGDNSVVITAALSLIGSVFLLPQLSSHPDATAESACRSAAGLAGALPIPYRAGALAAPYVHRSPLRDLIPRS